MIRPIARHARWTLATALSFATVLSFAAVQASASPLLELVGDTNGIGGFSGRSSVTGSGSAAAYFNPALLTHARPGLELGTFFLWDNISVSLDARPAGADVPVGIRGSNHEGTYILNGERVVSPSIEPNSLATEWLESGCPSPECEPGFEARPRGAGGRTGQVRAYQAVGFVQPLLDEHVWLGFHALLPLSPFTTAHAFFVDEREQFFTNSLHPELYGDRLTATSLAFGAGIPIGAHLSLGLGATIALKNDARAGTFVSDSDNQAETLLLSTDVEVRTRATPHFGLVWLPIERLSITATIHPPQRFDIGTGFSAALPDGNEQFADRTATHNFLPWNASAGAEFAIIDSADTRLSVVGELEFGHWTDYRNRQNERPQRGYEWADTFTPTLGARLEHDVWRVLTDIEYRPTPVPAQTGRTNYVDNDRLSGTSGFDFTFPVANSRLRVGANLQWHALVQREQTKRVPEPNPIAYEHDDRFGAAHYPQLVVDEVPDDALDGASRRGDPLAGRDGLQTNNPGFPGFGSGGFLFGGGVTLAFEY